MSETVVLSEYEDRRIDLSRDDATFVANRLGGRIAIRRDLQGDGYVLNPRQFVGLVTLPSGRGLECRPKVPARNLFVMLAAAFDITDPFLEEAAVIDRVEDVLAFFVARFAALVEERIDQGLYRAYVEEEGNLFAVRGRIAVAEDVRLNHVLRHRTYCRFAEYSWDVPENRVLRQVVRLLAGWRLDPTLRRRLQRLDSTLEEVTPGRFVAADVDRFVYNRLNEAYRPLHRLCRLFLEGASPTEDAGMFEFEAFFIDMNRLFEDFVTWQLRARAPARTIVDSQARHHLDLGNAVPIRPDLVVHRSGLAMLAADCKYKRLSPGQHNPHDVYQLLAYCTALGVDRGLIVYPRHLAALNDQVMVRNVKVVIREVAIDLGGSRERLEAECDALASLVFTFAA